MNDPSDTVLGIIPLKLSSGNWGWQVTYCALHALLYCLFTVCILNINNTFQKERENPPSNGCARMAATRTLRGKVGQQHSPALTPLRPRLMAEAEAGFVGPEASPTLEALF